MRETLREVFRKEINGQWKKRGKDSSLLTQNEKEGWRGSETLVSVRIELSQDVVKPSVNAQH